MTEITVLYIMNDVYEFTYDLYTLSMAECCLAK